jgi:hypothetical protein
MSKSKTILLSALVALAVSAVGASGASAAIKYEWSINGTPLSGTEKGTILTDTAAPTVTFQSTILNTDTELSSNKVKSSGTFTGGKPGTSAGKVTFENVEVTKPKKCAVHSTGKAAGIVETDETEGTIVEGTGTNAGKVLVLIKSKVSGEALTTLEFENKGSEECAIKGAKGEVKGSIVALQNKADTEKVQLFVFQAFGTKSKNSAGEESANELTLAGNAIHLTGSYSAEVSKLLGWGGL